MAALITKNEFIQAAFTRQISESRIPTDYLEVVQHKYLKPILGADFYDALVAAPSSYTALLSYVKPVLYYYLKYMILPELRNEISDLGTNTIQVSGATPLTDEGFAAQRDQCLVVAEDKVRVLNEYLEDNYTLYPLYYKGLNVSEKCRIVGGIVMRTDESSDFYGPEFGD
jgi:hypothetical protein